MSNAEKYDKAFIDILNVTPEQLPGLNYQDIETWDSVGHMGLIGALEAEFDIMMEMDDIIEFSSYEKGKEILAKADYGVEF
ncbi:MAG: acyl carrier protein [Selenomonadaceae bacterium]|nr:acyl carrier protein [Selenomonadaceae bacterium]